MSTRRSSTSTAQAIPPELAPDAPAPFAEMEKWADDVVAAWLERRTAELRWQSSSLAICLYASTDGRSIVDGECFVTRAGDGFLALVSGKRYRDPSNKLALQLLEGALARRGVPGVKVIPPPAGGYVDSEALERWWGGAKHWQGRPAEKVAERYVAIAEDMVEAFLGGLDDEMCTRYNDGYYLVEATRSYIYAGYECIVAKASPESRIALLSERRYRKGSHVWCAREAVRTVLRRRGVPLRELRPAGSGPLTSGALIAAWRECGPRLMNDDGPSDLGTAGP